MHRRYHHTSSFIDRHGKTRWRFRKAGVPPHYFDSPNGTPEFEAEWKGCFDGTTQAAKASKAAKPACPPQQTALVYFVGADHGPVKIGHSRNITERLKDIQWGSPHKIHLLAVAPGGQRAEARYHKRFFRHRLHGEWFERAPEIVREIDRLRTGSVYPLRRLDIIAA